MSRGVPAEAYAELVHEVRAFIRTHVPPGSVVLVVSKGDEELLRIDGYRVWHFPRDESGAYAGHHPASGVEAIAHLRHCYAEGAQYLVFPSTAAWWLEHYRELAEHLDSAHSLTASREGVGVIYQLQDSPAFDAFTLDVDGVATPHDGGGTQGTLPVLHLSTTRTGHPLRVLTILARFGSEQYGRAEQEMAELFARQMPSIERHVVVVDNALPRGFIEERNSWSVMIGGDNSSREFSAFDRAVDFVGTDIWSFDLVHFATSAFLTLYVAYLERFDPDVLQAVAGRPACLGHIDCYNEPVEVLRSPAQHWMRSGFFFLPPAEARALGSFVSVSDPAPFFSGNPVDPFRADAPISRRYREYITNWLTGPGVGQGVQWHSRFRLTSETLSAFEEKARAILNEQLLSIRLQALGCRLIDVTWLSAMLRRGDALEIPWSTPWRTQLANRDRDALVVAGAAPGPDRAEVLSSNHGT